MKFLPLMLESDPMSTNSTLPKASRIHCKSIISPGVCFESPCSKQEATDWVWQEEHCIVSKFEEMIHEVPDSPQQLIINEIEKSTQLVFPPTVPPRPLRLCRHR